MAVLKDLAINAKPSNRRVNPLRLDPTRTSMLRNQFQAEMRKRFGKLRRDIIQLVDTEDCFGLRANEKAGTFSLPTKGLRTADTRTSPLDAVFNTRWRFDTDDAKLDAYHNWLTEQVKSGVLEVSPGLEAAPWTDTYIKSSYKKGVIRAYTDTHAEKIAAGGGSFDFIQGGQAAFLDQAFNSPIAQGKLKLLQTRTFSQLKGVSAQMDTEMSRILADGIAHGKGPRELARELTKSVDGLEKKRALVIARTEIVHAHNEGQLDAFEAMNVEGVGVMAEWSTAHDGEVCEQCAPMEGVVLTIKEAQGMLPRHPNCRCAWIPAGVGEEEGGTTKTQWAGPEQGLEAPGTLPTGKTTGQTWSKDVIADAIRDSIKAERPGLGAAAARAASRWAGADLTSITQKLKPGSKAAVKAGLKRKRRLRWGRHWKQPRR